MKNGMIKTIYKRRLISYLQTFHENRMDRRKILGISVVGSALAEVYGSEFTYVRRITLSFIGT